MTTPFELAVVQMPLLPGRKTAACLPLPCMTPCLGEIWHLGVGMLQGRSMLSVRGHGRITALILRSD